MHSDSNPTNGRLLALGDVHGCMAAMEALLREAGVRSNDKIVALGDYVDRGPHAPQVIERLMDLQATGLLIPLMGNHELMMLLAMDEPAERDFWLQSGGEQTLDAYGGDFDAIPTPHLDFLRSCQRYYESERHIFLHANYTASLPLDHQPEFTLFWEHLTLHLPGPHRSGKQAIVGHTPQRHGEILHLGHVICIDTYCYGGGWLTLLDVESGKYWQANRAGELREGLPRRLE